jgi:hypothetical protein
MAIPFDCSSCSTNLQVPDNLAGKPVRCPKCGTVLKTPVPAPVAIPVIPVVQPKRENQGWLLSWTPRTFWIVGGVGGGIFLLLLILLLVVVLSASGSRSRSQGKGSTSDASVTKPPSKAGLAAVTEADAKSKLKTALDSWVFGDPLTRFESQHPGIHFGDLDRVQNLVLMRYEIGPSRPFGIGCYEFSVTLVFQSQAGTEIRRSAKYSVMPDESGKWLITGGAN